MNCCIEARGRRELKAKQGLLNRPDDMEDRILPAVEEPQRIVVKFVGADGSDSGDSMERSAAESQVPRYRRGK